MSGILTERTENRPLCYSLCYYILLDFSVVSNRPLSYAVADGLFALLAKYKQGINHMLFNPPKPTQIQLSIFDSQPFA